MTTFKTVWNDSQQLTCRKPLCHGRFRRSIGRNAHGYVVYADGVDSVIGIQDDDSQSHS